MFKSAFPWATKDEEHSERDYFKQLAGTDQQEIGGSIWCVSALFLTFCRVFKSLTSSCLGTQDHRVGQFSLPRFSLSPNLALDLTLTSQPSFVA